jgi:hypothetical protein
MASKRKDFLLEMLLYEVDLYVIISYLNITKNFKNKILISKCICPNMNYPFNILKTI